MIHTRTKIIMMIACAFFLGALTVYGVFLWMVTEQEGELAAERLRTAQIEAERKALSVLEATVLSSAGDREKLRDFILEDADIISLLSLIEQTAREQALSISTDKLTVNPVNDLYEELRMSFTISGSFERVMHMLRIFESLPQQSVIPSVALTKSLGDGKWQGIIEFKVTKFKKI